MGKNRNRKDDSIDVAGLGLCILDMVGLGKHYPPEDHKMTLDECDWQGGGPAATGVVTAHRLGASCSFIGQLGLDYIGQQILGDLKAEGIEVDAVRVYHDDMSCYAFSFTSKQTGSRTMFLNLNKYWNTYRLDARARERIARSKVLFIDRHETWAGIEAMKTITIPKGIPTVFDPSTRTHESTEEMLNLVTYPIIPRTFLTRFTKDDELSLGARRLFKKCTNAEALIVTLGAEGCYYVTRDTEMHVPAFKVKVKDSLGAGDVFHGAFCYALLQKRWNLHKKVIFATATAALKCRYLGGRRGIPRLHQVKAFLSKRGVKI